ncbi:MAG: small redox-active disulfide protein 2 [Cyclobacteriaceae bacterium]|jgi:small redox-active disulfide protein 2
MKTIKILGMGCPKCQQTVDVVNAAIRDLKIEAEVIKVEDIQAIMKYNIMSTPAIVVDEMVKLKGYVPSLNEVKAALI